MFWALIYILFLNSSQAKTTFTLKPVLQKLSQIRALPGDLFPSICWPEFESIKAKPDQSTLRCRFRNKSEAIREVAVTKSGTLIAHVTVTTTERPSNLDCNLNTLKKLMPDSKSKIIDQREGEAIRSAALRFEYKPEMIMTFLCVPANPRSGFTIEIKTPYSDLGTKGVSPMGNVVDLSKTTVVESPPYDAIKMAEFSKKSESLGPLAKKLFQDNMNWAKKAE